MRIVENIITLTAVLPAWVIAYPCALKRGDRMRGARATPRNTPHTPTEACVIPKTVYFCVCIRVCAGSAGGNETATATETRVCVCASERCERGREFLFVLSRNRFSVFFFGGCWCVCVWTWTCWLDVHTRAWRGKG